MQSRCLLEVGHVLVVCVLNRFEGPGSDLRLFPDSRSTNPGKKASQVKGEAGPELPPEITLNI